MSGGWAVLLPCAPEQQACEPDKLPPRVLTPCHADTGNKAVRLIYYCSKLLLHFSNNYQCNLPPNKHSGRRLAVHHGGSQRAHGREGPDRVPRGGARVVEVAAAGDAATGPVSGAARGGGQGLCGRAWSTRIGRVSRGIEEGSGPGHSLHLTPSSLSALIACRSHTPAARLLCLRAYRAHTAQPCQPCMPPQLFQHCPCYAASQAHHGRREDDAHRHARHD